MYIPAAHPLSEATQGILKMFSLHTQGTLTYFFCRDVFWHDIDIKNGGNKKNPLWIQINRAFWQWNEWWGIDNQKMSIQIPLGLGEGGLVIHIGWYLMSQSMWTADRPTKSVPPSATFVSESPQFRTHEVGIALF